VDLLLSKGVVNSYYLHKISHSFPKVVPSERTSITTRVANVHNTTSTIQMRVYTPRAVLLDTNAQQVILRVKLQRRKETVVYVNGGCVIAIVSI
jgi:hypothetical protein